MPEFCAVRAVQGIDSNIETVFRVRYARAFQHQRRAIVTNRLRAETPGDSRGPLQVCLLLWAECGTCARCRSCSPDSGTTSAHWGGAVARNSTDVISPLATRRHCSRSDSFHDPSLGCQQCARLSASQVRKCSWSNSGPIRRDARRAQQMQTGGPELFHKLGVGSGASKALRQGRSLIRTEVENRDARYHLPRRTRGRRHGDPVVSGPRLRLQRLFQREDTTDDPTN